MKKINNKGFMLAELLAVTVVILAIFTSIYINFYPTRGEYERRIEYNDIDSLYANYYFKVFLLKYFNVNQSIENTILNTTIKNNGYATIVSDETCTTNYSLITNGKTFSCSDLVSKYNIKEVILTKYITNELKTKYLTGSLKNYINALPDYEMNQDGDLYRIIVRTKKLINATDINGIITEKELAGYATDQFYSKVCNEVTYGEWGPWSIKFDCDSTPTNMECQSGKLHLDCVDNMVASNCNNNPLCKNGPVARTCEICNNCGEVSVYRRRTKYSNSSDTTNWSVSPC